MWFTKITVKVNSSCTSRYFIFDNILIFCSLLKASISLTSTYRRHYSTLVSIKKRHFPCEHYIQLFRKLLIFHFNAQLETVQDENYIAYYITIITCVALQTYVCYDGSLISVIDKSDFLHTVYGPWHYSLVQEIVSYHYDLSLVPK